MPPTFKSLLEIQGANDTKNLLAHCQAQPSLKYIPKIVKYQNNNVFLYNSDSGYEKKDPSNTEKLDRITFEDNIINYQKR